MTWDPLAIYARGNRRRLLWAGALLIASVAYLDWLTIPYFELGFLYLLPILALGGVLSRTQIVGIAGACAALQEMFSSLPPDDAGVRVVASAIGFAATGLFVSELARNRQIAARHVEELQAQARLRRDAEAQVQALVDSNPAAIVTVGHDGHILLANAAATELLADDGRTLVGELISRYLPALASVVGVDQPLTFRTTLQCAGRRSSGEMFMAGVWFSTFPGTSGPRVAAIVVDLSEELRSHEDLSLDHLNRHARILMTGVAHEIRNLSSAALVAHKNLSRLPGLDDSEDFLALGTLMQGLERLSGLALRPDPGAGGAPVDLRSVLDELRVLLDSPLREAGIVSEWTIPDHVPLVWADRYGLVQVFLNLTRNSQRALAGVSPARVAFVVMAPDDARVQVHVRDSGPGVPHPDDLFRPFQRNAEATGLGLYVSRAILRGVGGDLTYRAQPEWGACFVVSLATAMSIERDRHA